MSEMIISKYFDSKHQSRRNLLCVVCSEKAFGMNFNAITCQSCKAFFRRNAFKSFHSFRCLKNQTCIIDISSRRNCPPCRLAKCLAVGMNPHLIQSAEEKFRRKQQKFKPLKQIFIFKENNQQYQYLNEQDYILLQQINQAYQNRTYDIYPMDSFSQNFLSNNDLFIHCSNLNDVINLRSISILHLISFIKLSSSLFQYLNDNDRLNLIKYNIPTLFWFSMALGYNPITNIFCLDEQRNLFFNCRTFYHFYGINIYNRIIKNLRSLHQFVTIDPMIIHLLILCLLFSHYSSCISLVEPIYLDINSIRYSQNIYLTLLIRILFERFGQHYVNNLFSKLIFLSLNIQNLNRDICSIDTSEIFYENISHLMQIFLIR